MRVANKLTPEPKSKTTETKPEHKSEQFQDKTLQLFVPNSKRLGGYTQMDVLKKHKPLEDAKKRYTVSLRKALEQHRRNKTRLLELNHEVLGGLLILRCFCNQGKDQMLTTSRVKRKAEKKKLNRLEIAGPKSFQY